jgi:hypothetical protein
MRCSQETEDSCKPDDAALEALEHCLKGFAIQGNMDSRRRNYTQIWDQLDQRINGSAALRSDDRFCVNVVGTGSPAKLGIPERLAARVLPHADLRFEAFYETIHRNFALIPAMVSEAYYDRKFSSTIITSLVTGVPIIVQYKFLTAYTFMSKDNVYMQWNAEPVSNRMSGRALWGTGKWTSTK